MARIFRGTTWRHSRSSSQHNFKCLGSGGAIILPSGVAYFRCRGTNDGSYLGDKIRATGHETPGAETLGGHIAVDQLAFSFQACFNTPPANYLEVLACYATLPTTVRGSTLASHCWMGLGTDGKFRLFNSWVTGSPPTGDEVAVATTAIAGMYTGTWGPTHEARAADVPSLMRDYVVLIKCHATAGEWHVWEDGTKIATATGLNTLGAVIHSDLIHCFSLGQRPPQPDYLDDFGTLAPGSNPFPGNAEFQARFQNYVVSDDVIGRCRVRTLFPTATGFYDQWGEPQDPFDVFEGAGTKADMVRDDPEEQGGPDQDVTYLPSDGLFQTFTHDGMSALGPGELLQAVGVSNYIAAAFEAALPRGAIQPMLMIDPDHVDFYLGDFRPLWDAYTEEWPLGVPNGGSGTDGGVDEDDFLGEVGFRYHQDWWTDPPLLDVAVIDAAEFGCNSGTAEEAWLSQATMLVISAIPVCEGPPSNPYPPTDPPIPPLTLTVPAWKHGKFVQCTDGWEWRNGAFRKIFGAGITDAQKAWYHGKNVEITPFFDGETIPEPDTPLPPHHDPCYIMPIIDPGETIPIAGRFFGMSNMPMGHLGALFTGTQKALGPWYYEDLPFAASRGCVLVGAQGGGALIKVNGDTWDLATFLAGSRLKIGPQYPLIAAGTITGEFFGYSMADDITSTSLWKPSGIPPDELATAIATLKTEFPDIRYGARCRPSQIPFDPGLDFYYVQYSAERGDAAAFAAAEYAIALARGAYLIVCVNFLHGGDGSSGVRYANGTHKGQSEFNWMCSPLEVATYIPAMLDACVAVDGTAAKVAGVLGYQYNEAFLALDMGGLTMIDAMVIGHNAVAGLPALP